MASSLLRDLRSVKDLTDQLRFPSEDACRTWLRRARIPRVRRGRAILVDARDVEAKLRENTRRTVHVPIVGEVA